MYVSWVYYITLATGKQTQVCKTKKMCCDWILEPSILLCTLNGLTDKLRSLHWFLACGFGFVFLYVMLLDLWNLKLVITFFLFLWIFFFGGAQDLRLDDHNEDKFRPNNTPDWHFFV
jgi:hypothetical protein